MPAKKAPPMNNPAEQERELRFTDHLIELRTRLIRIFIAMAVVFIVLFHFSNEIYNIISLPLTAQLPKGSTLIATQITSTFLAPLKLTFYVSLFLCVPYILHHLWAFIAPALYQHEKKIALSVLISSIILFCVGIAFVYFVALPLVMFPFFLGAGPTNVAIMPDIDHYLDLILALFLVFGFAFEIPIITLLLVASGITSIASLIEKRPYIIVGCFAISMFLTPPDALSQILLAVPMWLLFEAGIWMTKLLKIGKSPS
jgi:sec-independent protein translocase protein TatC